MASENLSTRRLITGASWATSGKAITLLSGIVINIFLARLLSQEELGNYFLAVSVALMAAKVGQLGMSRAAVRLIAEGIAKNEHGKVRQFVWRLLSYGTVGTLLVTAGLMCGGLGWIGRAIFGSQSFGMSSAIMAVLVLSFALQELTTEILRGFQDIRGATAFGQLARNVISVSVYLVIWLMHKSLHLDQALIIPATASVIGVGFALGLIISKRRGIPAQQESVTPEVFATALPMWITCVTLFALTQADIWIIGMFRPEQEVAIYGAAARLAALVGMPLVIANEVISPVISDLHARGEANKLQRMLRTVAGIASVPAIAVFSLFALTGGWLMGFFFGTQYMGTHDILIILGVGRIVNVLSGACGTTLMMTGQQRIMMSVTVLSGILSVLLGILLVQQYGAVGVATAGAVALVVQNGLMLFFARSRSGVWTHAWLPSSVIRR